MTWQILRKRAMALALAAVLTVTLTVPAAAEEVIGDGVAPTYDEAYYATLDYYGNLLEGSVVKSYAMNGRDSLTDYGVYDAVENLTDGTAPVNGEGTTSFRFGSDVPDHFYFEGRTKQPFEDLPWTLTLRYTLNGVPAKAEDLAGKQGVVEILLDIVPNELASDYARYNYTLAATALFNQDDILSLEAEGAQVQLVGNLRTVLFLCLPGEEQHFTIRVGSNDFSFGGMTVMMMPATLAQLEEIAKLSQRKDDLEEDYRALSGSLDDLLDALADIQNGLYASAKGLDQLEAARSTFSGGKGKLYSGADALRGDLSNLADLLEPVEQRVQLLSQTVTDSKAVLNEMTDATLDLQDQLAEMEIALYGLELGTSDLKHVIDVAGDMESSLLRLEHALGGSHVNTHSVATNSRALVEQVKNAHGAYSADTQAEFLQKLLEAQGMGSAQAQATVASQLAELQRLQEAMAQGYQPNEKEQAALKQAQDMQNLYAAAKGGMISFQDFCGNLPSVTEDQAKQMNDLWLIYSSGGSTSVRNRTPSEILNTAPAAPAPETPDTSQTAAPTPEETPAPGTPPTPEKPSDAPQNTDTSPDTTPDITTTPDAAAPADTATSSNTDSTPDTASTPDAPSGTDPEPSSKSADAAVPETSQERETSAGEDAEPLRKGQMSARLVFNGLPGEDGGEPSSDEPSGSGTTDGSGTDSGTGGGSTSGGTTGGGSTSGGTTGGGTGGGTTGGGTGGGTTGGGTGGGTTDSGTGGGTTDDGIGGGTGGGTPGDGTTGGGTGGDGTTGGGTNTETPGKPANPNENQTVGGAVVDLIASGLDNASAQINRIQYEITSTLNEIKYPTSAVVGDLADLCGELNILIRDLEDAENLMAALRKSSGTLREILADVDALRNVLNGYEPTLQEALANTGSLSASAVTTIRDTETLLSDAENLARSTGKDLDAGTKQSLKGLSAALRQTAKALATTAQVKEAKNTVTQIIEDTWNEYTGDVNNILLMDATAEAVSLTDPRNPAPDSIQILIRTQEIKTEEPEEDEEAAAAKAKTTFWGRVTQMFRDFWNAVTGIFH